MNNRRTRLIKKRNEATDTRISKIATSDPAALRDTKKLAILNVQTTAHLALTSQGTMGNAYLIGQQRVQSMPQTLAKSRTIPPEM